MLLLQKTFAAEGFLFNNNFVNPPFLHFEEFSRLFIFQLYIFNSTNSIRIEGNMNFMEIHSVSYEKFVHYSRMTEQNSNQTII